MTHPECDVGVLVELGQIDGELPEELEEHPGRHLRRDGDEEVGDGLPLHVGQHLALAHPVEHRQTPFKHDLVTTDFAEFDFPVDRVEGGLEERAVAVGVGVVAAVLGQEGDDGVADVAVQSQAHVRLPLGLDQKNGSKVGNVPHMGATTTPHPLEHGGDPEVGEEGLLEQPEEEVPVLDAVDPLQEEGHALLVPGDQPGGAVGAALRGVLQGRNSVQMTNFAKALWSKLSHLVALMTRLAKVDQCWQIFVANLGMELSV